MQDCQFQDDRRFPKIAEKQPLIAFGPEMAGWGSWEWVGVDLQQELSKYYGTVSFTNCEIPNCDVVFVIKHALPFELLEQVSREAAVLYAPVDYYGSGAEIDGEAKMLRKCSRILIHCERLRRFFEPYAPVEYMDHHVKFAAPVRKFFRPDGYLMWSGVRTNLPPLVNWVNDHPLPGKLVILTNPENPEVIPQPQDLGFRGKQEVCIEMWSKEKQFKLTQGARAAIDIKGTDFRSRHKPPAKAIDFIASGLPLAMNPDSSPSEHLARFGFEVASPLDSARWLSKAYWQEIRRFGQALREILSLERIGRRYKRIIDEVLLERQKQGERHRSGK
jgi:hypothetical protein